MYTLLLKNYSYCGLFEKNGINLLKHVGVLVLDPRS